MLTLTTMKPKHHGFELTGIYQKIYANLREQDNNYGMYEDILKYVADRLCMVDKSTTDNHKKYILETKGKDARSYLNLTLKYHVWDPSTYDIGIETAKKEKQTTYATRSVEETLEAITRELDEF